MNNIFTSFFNRLTDIMKSDEEQDYTKYYVLVGSQTISLYNLWFQENKKNNNHNINNKIYFEDSMVMIARNIAIEYYNLKQKNKYAKIEEINSRIILIQNIFITGRKMHSILTIAENVFINTYSSLIKSDNKKEKYKYQNLFLSIVYLVPIIKSDKNDILSRSQHECILKSNIYERKKCFEIEYNINKEIVKQSGFATLPFISAKTNIKLLKKYCSDYLDNKLLIYKNSKYNLNNFSLTSLNIDNSIYIKSIFSFYIYNNTVCPIVFLPIVNIEKIVKIATEISKYVPSQKCIILNKIEELDLQELHEYLIKFIYALLNVFMLKAFINEINNKIKEDDEKMKLYLDEENIKSRFANDQDILELFKMILSDNEVLDVKLEDLKRIINLVIEKDKYLFIIHENMKTNINENIINPKVIEKIERVMFSRMQEIEIKTNSLIYGNLSPSDEFVRSLNFPYYNDFKSILNEIYGYRNSWILEEISIYDMISILLDYYYLGLFNIEFTINNSKVIQFIKFERMAIYNYIYRFVMYLPILNEIRNRCLRKRLENNKEIFYQEFILFFKHYKNNINLLNNIEKDKLKLLNFSYRIIDAKQNHSDYFFLINIKLKELNLSITSEELIKYFNNLYNKVIYGC